MIDVEHGTDQLAIRGAAHGAVLEMGSAAPPISTSVPEHLKALPWSTGFFRLPRERQLEALAELEADLAAYRSDVGIRVPFSSYLVTAASGK